MTASDATTEAVVERPSTDDESADAPPDGRARPEESDDVGSLPLDVVFGILKNRRRRLVLHYLVGVTETTTLSDLAEHIAALENDKPEQELTSSERKRVYVCLYQCHLPKMDDAGVIDFETDRGTVELANNTEEFTRYMSIDDEPEPDWPRYYVALAAVGGVAFVGQRLFFPSSVLSGVVIGVMLGLFANLALEHARDGGILRPPRDEADEASVAASG